MRHGGGRYLTERASRLMRLAAAAGKETLNVSQSSQRPATNKSEPSHLQMTPAGALSDRDSILAPALVRDGAVRMGMYLFSAVCQLCEIQVGVATDTLTGIGNRHVSGNGVTRT
jgi:hypothetical protein